MACLHGIVLVVVDVFIAVVLLLRLTLHHNSLVWLWMSYLQVVDLEYHLFHFVFVVVGELGLLLVAKNVNGYLLLM